MSGKANGFVRRETDLDWVRDENGVAHAIRQSEWPHHTAFCCKYVRGDYIQPCQNVYGKCLECWKRAVQCIVPEGDEKPAQCLVRGHGLHCKKMNGKPI